MKKHKTTKNHGKKGKKGAIPEQEEEKQTEQLMDEGLRAIYGEHAEAFDRLERKEQKTTNLLIAAVVILSILAIASWAGFFLYSTYFQTHHNKQFELEIVANEEIVSGETVQIDIQYNNPTTVPIASLDIDINLPSAFHIESFSQEPTNGDDLIWELGSLPGLTDDTITINGVWIASNPSQMPIQAYATYKPGNFNSSFEEISTTHITTLDSKLILELSGTEEVSAGQPCTYEVSMTNTADIAFEQLSLLLDLPQGFYIEASDPEIISGSAPEWIIDRIDPEEEKIITFEGVFASMIEDFQYFTTTLSLLSENQSLQQAQAQTYTDVLQSDMSIQIVANGATEQAFVEPGENLRISIGLENTTDQPIETITALLDFQSNDSIPIHWNQAQLDNGVITQDGIYWTLDSIEPGEKILFNTSFPLDSSLGVGDADMFTLISSADYSGRTILSSPINVALNTQAELSSHVRYYNESGMAVGSGPLPPQVGEMTTYRVFWDIDNSLHDIKDITVTAELPPHVTWQASSEQNAGSINYNEETKTITWQISPLTQEQGSAQSSFLISITPDMDDLGSFVKLISGTDLSAIDTITGKTIESSTESLTTDLEDDLYASVEGGTVIE